MRRRSTRHAAGARSSAAARRWPERPALREERDEVALRSTDRRDGGPTPSERPTVAAFDFDGTLTNAGSGFPFLVHVRGLIPVLRAVLALSPGLIHAALVGGTTADKVKEKLFTRLLAGMPA